MNGAKRVSTRHAMVTGCLSYDLSLVLLFVLAPHAQGPIFLAPFRGAAIPSVAFSDPTGSSVWVACTLMSTDV